MRRGRLGVFCLCAMTATLLSLISCVQIKPTLEPIPLKASPTVEPTSLETSVPTSVVVSTPSPSRLYILLTPIAIPTPTMFPLPSVTIVDVRLSGQTEVKLVTIANFGDVDIDLSGWQIALDEDTFIFPEIMLHAHTGLCVHTGSGVSSGTQLYWGLQHPAQEEDKVVLLNSQGIIVDQFLIRK